MVEPIMYLAIGFLISILFCLMIVPLVHNRAVRLTVKRLEASTPLSRAEIQADKDQLRAEFALSTCRLETSVQQLRNKTTTQLAELGRKSDIINRLKIELGEKNAAVFTIEAREQAMKDQLHAKNAAIEEQLQAAHANCAKLQQDLDAIQQQTESSRTTERMENALLREQINDIAAEIASLVLTIEGQDSPIQAILATKGTTVGVRDTLADKIRTLQSHASQRLRQTG